MKISTFRQSDCGGALVELAVALPVMLVLLFATIDFGRVFYQSMAVTNAARAGAQYGAQSVAKSSDTTGMIAAAQSSATGDIGAVQVTAARECMCATSTGTITATSPTANDCSNACSGGHLIVMATVTAQKSFSTVVRYPGIQSNITLVRSARMRAQ